MQPEITGLCHQHSFEKATQLCSGCALEFCDDCVVWPFKKALCKACAMAAGGVRSGAARPQATKREMKSRQRIFGAKLAARQAPEPMAPVLTDPILNTHDPIGGPTGDDLDRIGVNAMDLISAPASVPSPPAMDFEDAASDPLPVRPGPKDQPDQVPGDDVAPQIDWSNPFG